jgi:hypothetical protein
MGAVKTRTVNMSTRDFIKVMRRAVFPTHKYDPSKKNRKQLDEDLTLLCLRLVLLVLILVCLRLSLILVKLFPVLKKRTENQKGVSPHSYIKWVTVKVLAHRPASQGG